MGGFGKQGSLLGRAVTLGSVAKFSAHRKIATLPLRLSPSLAPH